MKCEHFIIVGISMILLPIGVNLLCTMNAYPYTVETGDNPWIAFWGSYLGGTVTALITMYVLYQTTQNEKKRKMVDDQTVLVDKLCNDLGMLCTAIDYEKVTFLFVNNANNINWEDLHKNLSDIEINIKLTYNIFFLKYGHLDSENKSLLCRQFNKYVEEISKLVTLLTKLQPNNNIAPAHLTFEISKIIKRMESYGDINSELLNIAEKWKHEEFNRLTQYKERYYCTL